TGAAAPPLPALAARLARAGVLAVGFEQPYRVAGRRAPDRAAALDAALLDGLATIRTLHQVLDVVGPHAPLVLAGRSSGARVACRTATTLRPCAVLALGFPYQPPGGGSHRGAELAAAGRACPVLVVQGDRDPFGCPGASSGVEVRLVPGGHSPTLEGVDLGATWLVRQLAAASRESGGPKRR
ncbi:MAG: alpha/beta family hydrolase, partial [Mycobacteriales bacterium]